MPIPGRVCVRRECSRCVAKLVVGNWKMNGGLAANAALLGDLVGGWEGAPDRRIAVCVPYPYLAQAQAALPGDADRLGRAGRERARLRRLHRRSVGGDAGGVRLPLRDRRPLGAPAVLRRHRRGRRGQGRGGAGGGADARSSASARRWRSAKPGRPTPWCCGSSTRCSACSVPTRRGPWSPTSRCGRSAPAAPRRPSRRRRCTRRCARAWREAGAGGHPAALRRQRQGRQRGGAVRDAGHRRRTDRRRVAQGGGIPGDRARLTTLRAGPTNPSGG